MFNALKYFFIHYSYSFNKSFKRIILSKSLLFWHLLSDQKVCGEYNETEIYQNNLITIYSLKPKSMTIYMIEFNFKYTGPL